MLQWYSGVETRFWLLSTECVCTLFIRNLCYTLKLWLDWLSGTVIIFYCNFFRCQFCSQLSRCWSSFYCSQLFCFDGKLYRYCTVVNSASNLCFALQNKNIMLGLFFHYSTRTVHTTFQKRSSHIHKSTKAQKHKSHFRFQISDFGIQVQYHNG